MIILFRLKLNRRKVGPILGVMLASLRSCRVSSISWRQLAFTSTSQATLHTGKLVHADITGFFPHECPALSKDKTGSLRTMEIMHRACSEAGMNVLQCNSEEFGFEQESTPPGFTGALLLDASHATSHCYSLTGQIALDVFTCGSVCPGGIMESTIPCND